MGYLKTDLWVGSAVNGLTRPSKNSYQLEVVKRMEQLHNLSKGVSETDKRWGYTAMMDDDMSFMREVFMPDEHGNEKPRLPYNEFIYEWGLHPVSQGKGEALADMHRKYGDHFICRYRVPRPSGRVVELSVISGMMFYSRKGEPYEVMVNGGEDNHGDPLAYQTDEDLMLLIAKLLTEGESDGIPK